MDRGAWWATVHGATESDMTEPHTHTQAFWMLPTVNSHLDFRPWGRHCSGPQAPPTSIRKGESLRNALNLTCEFEQHQKMGLFEI